jgi:hypothetical protein
VRLLGRSGVGGRRGASSPCAPVWASRGLGSRAPPHKPPPFAEAVYSATLTHCNQYVLGFRRGAPHGKPRRVERRVARESAHLRGGRHVGRTAASSAADPTETYAHDDTPHPKTCYETSRLAHVSADDPRRASHEISHSKQYAAKSGAPSVLLHGRRAANCGREARRPIPVQPRPYRLRRVEFG